MWWGLGAQAVRRSKYEILFWRGKAVEELRRAEKRNYGKTREVDKIQFTLYLRVLSQVREELGMPRKEDRRVEWVGYVNKRMTDQSREQLEAWDFTFEDCFDLLVRRVEQGYKFTLAYMKDNDTFTASLTCNDPKSADAGMTLNGFAPSSDLAIRVLMFKDSILLSEGWSGASDPLPRIG